MFGSTIETLKKQFRPYYFRYLSKRADSSHVKQSAEKLSVNGASHVIILVIDALRPDRIPNLPLDFTHVISPSTWTFPAVTSLHTGQYPHEHGAVAHTSPDDDSFAMPEQTSPEHLLPRCFEARGYETLGAFGFPMPFIATKSWYQTHRVFGDASAEQVLEVYNRWRPNRSKTFAYLHFGDLHAPLTPPDRYVEEYAVDTSLEELPYIRKYTESYDGSAECRYYRKHRLRLYDATVAYIEDVLRPVIEELTQKNTVVLLTADHGEAHWEHTDVDRQMTDSRPNYGVGHGGTPFDMVSRVPVGVSEARLKPDGGWASLRDIPKTLLNYCSESTVGNVFGGAAWQNQIPEDRVVFSEAPRYGVERKAAYQGDKKVIKSVADDVTLYAKIDGDTEEFSAPCGKPHSQLVNTLPESWNSVSNASEINPMVSEQLDALGYK